MNRDPNVVTRGLGERMVKPATEILWAGFLFVADEQNNERQIMSLLKRLCREENGQGLTEYTLVIVLVALVFWIGVRDTQVGQSLAQGWAKVLDCITSPFSCTA
jgi:Flp pilus assembly pilin Flp